MALTQLAPPYPIFTDKNGGPLDAGYLYFGEVNKNPETNPIQVYYDSAFTQPAAQPLRTSNGYVMRNGSPALIYAGSQFSVTVRDKRSELVIYAPSGYGVTPGTSASFTDQITYNEGSLGAVDRSLTARLRDFVSVKDFGVVGDGVTDDTAAIQAAIDTQEDVFFPEGNYRAVGIVLDNNQQRIFSIATVLITKNGNGTVFSGSGNDVRIEGISVRGDVDVALSAGYTGDNISMTGERFQFVRGGSMWTPGRALKATGGAALISDPVDPIATSDTGGSGYDIELGSSGTATLYHRISNWNAGSFDGGLLLIDTGSHALNNSLFGKLTIQSGTSPAGSNGGMTSNCRIGRNINVGISNACFSSNQPSSANCTVTFLAGTSGCQWVGNSNPLAIVNNGNVNNYIQRELSTGGYSKFSIGPDAALSQVFFGEYAPGSASFQHHVHLNNGYALRSKDSGGSVYSLASMIGNNTYFGDNSGFSNISAGSGGMYLVVDGASRLQATTTALLPTTDGTYNLGGASNKYGTVYAATGTINTSDANEKQDIADLDAAEKRVAAALKGMVKKFRFKDAVAQRGEAARIHIGVIAQEVGAAFTAEGLDANRYGIFCYDEWEESPAVVDDDENILFPQVDAGHRYGVRYEELLAFIIAVM